MLTWTKPVSETLVGAWSWGGWSIASNLDLPRLHEAPDPSDVRFTWRFSRPPRIPDPTESWTFTARDGFPITLSVGGDEVLFRYEADEVGIFAIRSNDRAIDFYPHGDPDPMRVEHWLVNSVLAVMAGLSGVLCLHAASVFNGRGAVVLAGPSGVGKSTAAASMVAAGWTLMADDATTIRRRPGEFLVFPGARTVRIPPAGHQGWINRGKQEISVTARATPATLVELCLLSVKGPDYEIGESEIFRSVCAMVGGWRWIPRTKRERLAGEVTDLLEEVPLALRARSFATNRSSRREEARVAPSTDRRPRSFPDGAQ